MALDTKIRILWAALAIPGVLLGIGASYKSGGLAGLRELTHDALESIGFEREVPTPTVTNPSVQKPRAGVPSVALAADEIFWLTIKDSSAPALFEEFLRKFPASPHAKQAQAKLQELKTTAAERPTAQPPAIMPMRGRRGGPMMLPPDLDGARPPGPAGGG
jgi:hypothetical protein